MRPALDLRDETSDWPVGALAVAILGPAGVIDRLDTAATDVEPPRHFAWASVTKLLTALTVLDGCADGTVDLDEPAGPPGATVRHLLAHAAGVPPEAGGPTTQPGRRRIYSNFGYELLADHLATRAGGPFVDELAGRVLGPLGLSGTTVPGSPARSGRGPLDDLIRVAAELLEPSIIGPEVVGWASTVAFPGLDGVLPGFGRQQPNDWGLGCEIRAAKTPHWTSPDNSPATFGHFGQSGSFLWVDPVARLACVGLCDTDFGPWAAQVWPRLSSAVLATYRG